jgi:hypothetical protein
MCIIKNIIPKKLLKIILREVHKRPFLDATFVTYTYALRTVLDRGVFNGEQIGHLPPAAKFENIS